MSGPRFSRREVFYRNTEALRFRSFSTRNDPQKILRLLRGNINFSQNMCFREIFESVADQPISRLAGVVNMGVVKANWPISRLADWNQDAD